MIHSTCMGNKIYGFVFAFAFHFKSFQTQFKNKNQAHSLPFLLLTGCPDACLGQGDTAVFCFTIWHHPAMQIFLPLNSQ